MLNVYILLDRTGSMLDRWVEAVNSVNDYVKELTEHRVHVATFDNKSYDVLRDVTDESWMPIAIDEVSPRGFTNLYDSASKLAIKVLADSPEKAVVVVITDGEENASQHHTRESTKALFDTLESRGWPVVFLGANFDNVDKVSASVGRGLARSVNLETGSFSRGMGILAIKSKVYAQTLYNTDADAVAAMNFTDEEKAVAAPSKEVK